MVANSKTTVLEDCGLKLGRKLKLRKKKGVESIVPRANIISLKDGKIWYGDVDLVTDLDAISKAAALLEDRLYIVPEHDARYGNECRPAEKLIKKAIWCTEKLVF